MLGQVKVPLLFLLFRQLVGTLPDMGMYTRHSASPPTLAILSLNPLVAYDLPLSFEPDTAMIDEGKVKQRLLIARRDGTWWCGIIYPWGDLVGRDDSFFFSLLRISRWADNVDITLS